MNSDDSGGKDRCEQTATIAAFDEYSVRCGFRDFRFENGYFRLNGRRIFLKCSHTGNHCPVGQQLPHDPDLLRRDLHNVKVMGFNAIRFIAGVATRYQLDLCDEIGLLVYEEPYANWCLEDSPKMAERFDRSLGEMILRDRNHPSIVIWGLLNETRDGPVFRHAVEALKLVRSLDDSRMVMLNSGRWDKWTNKPVVGIDIVAADRRHGALYQSQPDQPDSPRPGDHLGAWTARHASRATASRRCSAGRRRRQERSIFPRRLRASRPGRLPMCTSCTTANRYSTERSTSMARGPSAILNEAVREAGDRLDFAVGFGNGNYGADSTGLDLIIKSDRARCTTRPLRLILRPILTASGATDTCRRDRVGAAGHLELRRVSDHPGQRQRRSDRQPEQSRLHSVGGRPGRSTLLPSRSAHGRHHPHTEESTEVATILWICPNTVFHLGRR